jgi:MFS family permease
MKRYKGRTTDIQTVIAPLSEMYGRLPLYHSCNFLFIVFTIAAAVATNMGQFIVFRFFMGCTYLLPYSDRYTLTGVGFGGAPMVLGGGTIADLIPREQRGTAMAVWMMGPSRSHTRGSSNHTNV